MIVGNSNTGMMSSGTQTPANVSSVVGWWESDNGVTASTYTSTGKTGTGTSGTPTITTSGDLSVEIVAGSRFRIGATDIYTALSVSTSIGITTITTVGNLSTDYTAQTIFRNPVTQLDDKTANAYNATATGGFGNVNYILTASNSLPALLIIGIGGGLLIPSGIHSVAAGDSTVYCVCKNSVQDIAGGVVYIGDNSGGITMGCATTSTGTGYYGHTAASSTTVETAAITQTTFGILRGRRSGTTNAVSFNNSTEVTNASGGNNTATVASIGDGGNFNPTGSILGQIQALIICNASLTQNGTDDTIINNYLKTKYGTP